MTIPLTIPELSWQGDSHSIEIYDFFINDCIGNGAGKVDYDSYTKSLPPEKQACYIDYFYGCIFAYGAQIKKNYSGQQPSSTIFSQAISKHQFLINPLPWAGL